MRGAAVLYVEVRFTMMECSGLGYAPCKETFNLYSYQSDSDDATLTHPAWMENPWTKVHTVHTHYTHTTHTLHTHHTPLTPLARVSRSTR